MRILLNVGLAGTTAQNARDMLTTMYPVLALAVHQSDTESTLVAEVPHAPSGMYVRVLCAALNQDCIALYDTVTKRGWIEGPRAHQWEAFNPALFVKLNGFRLV